VTVLIGTSGWQYRSWRDAVYGGQPQKRWLEQYATEFQTVEVNNAFYRLPEKKTFEDWCNRTPDDFIVAVKISRYLTHIKRLRDPQEPVQRFVDRAEGLGKKLGPVLLQLPPNLEGDADLLSATLDEFPDFMKVAVEPRHDTWFTDDVRAVLEKHGAALCLADRKGLITPEWKTCDWGYVRFHEGRATPQPCYGRTALETWAERLAGTYSKHEEVYVYFNNDTNVCAVRDAAVFARACESNGLVVTRTPDRPIEVGVPAE
jgi:uncharacterized protein YecE (DUF72 family)